MTPHFGPMCAAAMLPQIVEDISDYNIRRQQRKFKEKQNKSNHVENLSSNHKSVNKILVNTPIHSEYENDIYNPIMKIDQSIVPNYTMDNLYSSF